MIKLGKESLLSIIESSLFVLGAIFFLLVIVIPSNPVWALVAGILFGLAGAIVWSSPLFVQLAKKLHNRIKDSTKVASAEDVAKDILDADNTQNDTYELHRADSYDDLTEDNIVFHPADEKPKTPTTKKS